MINEKDWRIYASSVRSSIVVIMLFSIVKSVVDFVGGLGSAVGDLMSFIESGTVDLGTDMFDIIGYVATFIIVIVYFTYMSGLGSFAKIQANEDDARGVRRIRSGMVWTLLATLVDYIPTVGGFISFLFLFIAFFVLLSGYSKLKNSLTFPVKARRGASVLFGSMFVQLIGNILDLIPIVGDLLETLFSFIAFCMVLNGWKKIKKADVNETPMTQMAKNMGVAPQALQQPQQSPTVSQDVVQQSVESEKIELQSVVEEKKESCETEIKENTTHSKQAPRNESKKFIIGGCALLAIIVAAVVILKKGGSSDNSPLNHPSPQWEKFVMTTSNGIKAYKEPNTRSLSLCVASENVDSDGPTTMFCWSDKKSDRKWTVRPWASEKNAILPVIEEADNWYKVQIEFEWGSVKPTIAYIEKSNCKEVFPEPITPKMLEKQSGVLYHVVESGEMKNLCLMNDLSNFEMDGDQLRIGELKNGRLSYIKPAVWIYTYEYADGEPLEIDFKDNEREASIYYNNDRAYAMRDYGMSASALDVRKLTNDEVKSVVESGIFNLQSSAIKVCYYFPSVRNSLVRFSLIPEAL